MVVARFRTIGFIDVFSSGPALVRGAAHQSNQTVNVRIVFSQAAEEAMAWGGCVSGSELNWQFR